MIREDKLRNGTGDKIEANYLLIERINPKSNSQGSSNKEYFNRGELSKEFSAFEKGEKIHINVITKKGKKLFFKIDAFADLVQRAQSTPANTHMYDLNNGNGLQLKDENNNILTIGIHNQKLRE